MEETANREIRNTATFNATVDRVWNAWTDPAQIAGWWGPDGFTTTIHEMDLREGGQWILTLHGPDGINYPNRSVFREIVPREKIVFEHFNPHFITTIIFMPQGDETCIEWTMRFDTEEMAAIIIKAHKAEEGQQQNIRKLQKYLVTPVNASDAAAHPQD